MNALIDTPGLKMKKRPYQSRAITTLIHQIQAYLNGTLTKDSGVKYDNSLLVEMATGSGKTFTVGKTLELILRIRDRYNIQSFSGLKVLILSNRIDGVEQFRDDIFYGRPEDGKPPILGDILLHSSTISTFHSRADNLSDLEHKYIHTDETTDTVSFEGADSTGEKDAFYFSTYQTADLKKIEEQIPYFDIIIIDEAHNVRTGNGFESLIDRLALHGRDNRDPIIIPVTATPTNLTYELFGRPEFSYPLAEYLASEYSPTVDYNIMTDPTIGSDTLDDIHMRIEEIQKMSNSALKKREVSTLISEFETLLARFSSIEGFAEHLLETLLEKDDMIKETVIFASSIPEADAIVRGLNTTYGIPIAEAYHSHTQRQGLRHLQDKNHPTQIVVAVEMFNESIDLPKISNVVFWRITNIARIFLQQFGRGLRGDGMVRYFDYANSFMNFAWIGDIYEQYKKHSTTSTPGGDSPEPRGDKLRITGISGASAASTTLDLSRIGFELYDLDESMKGLLSRETVMEYFRETPFEEWMSYSVKDIGNIDLQGKKITGLASMTGWENPNKVKPENVSGFQEFIGWVHGKEDMLLTKETVIAYFRETPFEEWMKYSKEDINNIDFQGKKITGLVNMTGWTNPNTVKLINPSGFQEFIRWVHGKEDMLLTKEKIIEYFRQTPFEEWMGYKYENIRTIDFQGKKITGLVNMTGWTNPNNVKPQTPSGFQEFIGWVHGKEDMLLTKETVIAYFRETPFEEWMGYSKKDIRNIDFQGKKIISLVSMAGWTNPNTVKLQNPSGFQEFIAWVHGKENDTKK